QRHRCPGAGRKPALSKDNEDLLMDWIMEERAKRNIVRRSAVQCYARELARQQGLTNFRASCKWLKRFMKEHNLVIRATSTMSKLSDKDVAKRAVAFKKFVDSREWWTTVRDHETVCMDETAIYLGHHGRKTTLDRRGMVSVPCNASGYESTRMTCILGYRRDGTKLAPMLVAKGETAGVDRIEGVEVMHSPKAWSTHKVLTKWVQRALPRISRQNTRRTRYAALVWDAAPTHRSKAMKQYLATRIIHQVMIPGRCTSTLQGMDLAIMRPFKAALTRQTEAFL
ncbi:unnamed protein product, partial [Heterosigma akashiwo]